MVIINEGCQNPSYIKESETMNNNELKILSMTPEELNEFSKQTGLSFIMEDGKISDVITKEYKQ